MSSRGVLDTALDAVGNTPLIRLDKIAKAEGFQCNLRKIRTMFQTESTFILTLLLIVGKLEFTSAGGSIKDRIAKAMVLAAERDGVLIPGKSVVIEPTSGNTGMLEQLESADVFLT